MFKSSKFPEHWLSINIRKINFIVESFVSYYLNSSLNPTIILYIEFYLRNVYRRIQSDNYKIMWNLMSIQICNSFWIKKCIVYEWEKKIKIQLWHKNSFR